MRDPVRSGPRRAAATAMLLVALLLVPAAAGRASPAATAAAQGEPRLELVGQTPTVDPGGAFVARVRALGAPAGSRLRASVHERVRSRSELERTFGAAGLRPAQRIETFALEGAGPDGAVPIVLGLGEEPAGGRAIDTAGVYPVTVELLDADGDRAAALVTHLVLRPPASPAAPPLDVAVVLRVGAAPADPGAPPLGEAALAASRSVVDAALAVGGVPVTLAPVPDTLARLEADGGPDGAALVEELRALAQRGPVLALPYVTTSPDALAAEGLGSELARQLDVGAAIQREVLGVAPSQATWLAGDDLGSEGLALLHAVGVRRVVVTPDHVELVPDGVLTPAGPFEVVAPRRRGRAADDDRRPVLDALATDPRLAELIDGSGAEPALLASRLVADLSMLWFERPATARAVVLPVAADLPGPTLQAVLDGLRAATLFRPVALDDAFRTAEPLTDRSGDVLRRPLLPEDAPELDEGTVEGVRTLRELRGSVESMVGPDAPVLAELERHALRATADGLDRGERRRELAAGEAAIGRLAAAIHTPEEATITLTAREGRVPLTIANDTGGPVDVRLHLTSPKLDLPGGDTRAMTLTEPRSRIDIAVRTRASGSFPFDVEITSPDGRITLASTTYSVRSTAVSGVGVVLSAGAGLFLIIWWARHWRETRRSTKLVNGDRSA